MAGRASVVSYIKSALCSKSTRTQRSFVLTRRTLEDRIVGKVDTESMHYASMFA